MPDPLHNSGWGPIDGEPNTIDPEQSVVEGSGPPKDQHVADKPVTSEMKSTMSQNQGRIEHPKATEEKKTIEDLDKTSDATVKQDAHEDHETRGPDGQQSQNATSGEHNVVDYQNNTEAQDTNSQAHSLSKKQNDSGGDPSRVESTTNEQQHQSGRQEATQAQAAITESQNTATTTAQGAPSVEELPKSPNTLRQENNAKRETQNTTTATVQGATSNEEPLKLPNNLSQEDHAQKETQSTTNTTPTGGSIERPPKSSNTLSQKDHAKKEITMKDTADNKSNEIRILVMGASGSGKSSFVAAVAKEGERVIIGHGTESCTTECTVYPTKYSSDDRQIVVIDTPGFNDPKKENNKTLKNITDFIREAGDISGVVYLYRCSDTRFDGDSKINFDVIKAMCGPKFYSRIALCSTFWNTISSSFSQEKLKPHKDRMRAYLKDDSIFGEVTQAGASYGEFWKDRKDGEDPCLKILRHFFGLWNPPLMVIQEELSKTGKLSGTKVGQLLVNTGRRTRDAIATAIQTGRALAHTNA
ncbi:hypothetical protein F4777DRAFT_102739 [Nemania sp. FL0916]|nr:hypothetical protein F4777DRAFT_102739 [Nemania sp. FL0916]